MTHPFYFDRLVAERHAQIQRDMQLSRVQVRAEQQPARPRPDVTRLDTRPHVADLTEQPGLRRAS